MGIHISKFKVYLIKSRIDLLEKINTKPYFILYDDDGQSIGLKTRKIWGNM